MPEYRIKDWHKVYENNRTRELKHMDWVPIPNRMDGEGYTELVDHQNGAAHLGAWLAIVEISSRREARGTLPSGGVGLEKTLARMSRLPVSIFAEVIPRLVGIGWLEETPQDDAGIPQDNATYSQDNAPRARALNGTEGNGREENGTEQTARRSEAIPFPICQPSELGLEGWDELCEAAARAGMSFDPDTNSDLCRKFWRFRDFENRKNCIQGICARIECRQYSPEEREFVPTLENYVRKNLWRASLRPRNRGQPKDKKQAAREQFDRLVMRDLEDADQQKVHSR